MNQKKVRKQKAKPVDKATPVIRKSTSTDVAKVTVTRSITTSMKAAPQWNASSALQAAVATWNVAADDLELNATVLADLRSKLVTAEASQRASRQSWRVAKTQVTAIVAVVCGGSPDQVHALGFDVLTRVGATAQAAPSGLVTLPGTAAGEAVVSWQRGSARHGFLVQSATDTANPATISASIPSTKTKLTITGAKSLSVVHFRVAAIDATSPMGMSPWSDWVACTVR